MKTAFRTILTVLVGVVLFACNQNHKEATAKEAVTNESSQPQGQANVQDDVSNPNILQIAIGSADHSTLVAAVQAASLENVLVNTGPLTVFAPTNEAFAKLPAGTVEDLLKP